MTASNFDRCLKSLLVHEGGNDDDPQDPGGRTSRGVTQRTYNAYCREHGKPESDVWMASDEEVKAIYRAQYWNPWCDQITSGVDYLFFDMAVNMGVAQAAKLFQRTLDVDVDGHMGMETVAAIQRVQNKATLIHDVSERRRAFYRSLKHFPRFGKGWLRRTDEVERDAIRMAPTISETQEVNTVNDGASMKANPSDVSGTIVSTEQAGGATAGGGLITTTLSQVQMQLSQFPGLKIAVYISLALTVVLGAYTIYAFLHKQKTNAAAGL